MEDPFSCCCPLLEYKVGLKYALTSNFLGDLGSMRIIVIIFVTLCICGCGVDKALKPAEPVGFIKRHHADLADDRIPFQYVWVNPNSELRKKIREQGEYTLYITPVLTDYLNLPSSEKEMGAKAHEIARFLHDIVHEEIEKQMQRSLKAKLVDKAEEAEVILEIALTEINVGAPLLYAGAWAVPLPGTATAFDFMSQPSLAIEARMFDPSNNVSVAEIADRKIPTYRILDLNKMTSTMSPLRDICGRWAKELSIALQSRAEDGAIKESPNFSLSLW